MVLSSGSALITGASSGIGAVYADRLAARGKDLVLVARRRDRLEELARSLERSHRRKVEIVEADLGSTAGLDRVKALLSDRNEIDTLVNNAGLGAFGGATSVNAEEVEQLVRVNVLALTSLSLAVAPRMKAVNKGTIINIGSLIAFKASPFAAAYCSSKAYVLNFTRSMQAEFAGTDVKIQLVIPGPVRTDFFGDLNYPVPDELFFTPEALVDAGLAGLDLGEEVSIPALHDIDVWASYVGAIQSVTDATQHGEPAARYRRA